MVAEIGAEPYCALLAPVGLCRAGAVKRIFVGSHRSDTGSSAELGAHYEGASFSRPVACDCAGPLLVLGVVEKALSQINYDRRRDGICSRVADLLARNRGLLVLSNSKEGAD